jgi:hypothetical protein
MRERGQCHLDRAMIDGDKNETERDLPQYQSGMGSLFVDDIGFRHCEKFC